MMFLLGARRKVGCLGKLPLAADFDLERRLGGGAEEALASWLRAIPKPEGGAGKVSAAGADDGWGFLLLAPRGREAIAGRLWPSTDSAGRFFLELIMGLA